MLPHFKWTSLTWARWASKYLTVSSLGKFWSTECCTIMKAPFINFLFSSCHLIMFHSTQTHTSPYSIFKIKTNFRRLVDVCTLLSAFSLITVDVLSLHFFPKVPAVCKFNAEDSDETLSFLFVFYRAQQNLQKVWSHGADHQGRKSSSLLVSSHYWFPIKGFIRLLKRNYFGN